MKQASRTDVVFTALMLAGVAVGCGEIANPTRPTNAPHGGTSLAPPLTDNARVGLAANASTSPIITFALDTPVQGSEAQLIGFDGTSGVLSYNTTKGAFTAVFDSSSVFFDAQIDKYIPVDPCRQFAIDYNAGGTIGDIGGVFSAIASMAGNGCLGRIHTDRSVPPNPVIPIRSFRPLSAF